MLNVHQSFSFMPHITATNTPLFSHKSVPKYVREKRKKTSNTEKSRQLFSETQEAISDTKQSSSFQCTG